MAHSKITIREHLEDIYPDVYTQEACAALAALAHFNKRIKEVMATRMQRRAARQQSKTRISFLDPESTIPGTTIQVQDARDGNFEGGSIPLIYNGSGFREQARRLNPMRPSKTASVMWPMPCSRVPMAGCSMAKMPWDKSPPCRSIISAI
ncbi:hypothetical protein [Spirosoma telluris]|uniref:hypothetical protein n=1 Tax=Spirosoma telluris TaxID=2183553 RepID=UPI002FC35DCC